MSEGSESVMPETTDMAHHYLHMAVLSGHTPEKDDPQCLDALPPAVDTSTQDVAAGKPYEEETAAVTATGAAAAAGNADSDADGDGDMVAAAMAAKAVTASPDTVEARLPVVAAVAAAAAEDGDEIAEDAGGAETEVNSSNSSSSISSRKCGWC